MDTIGASNDSIEIGRNLWSLLEEITLITFSLQTFSVNTKGLTDYGQRVLELLNFFRCENSVSLITDHNPLFRGNGVQDKVGSQIWLIEDGHNEMAVVDLKLSEKVLIIISMVSETMKTGAIASILVQDIHGDHINLTWFHEFLVQCDSVAIECNFWIGCLTVDHQTLDFRTKKIEEKAEEAE